MTLSILPIDRRKEERSQQPFKNVFLTFGANLEEMGNTSWVINDENHLKLLRKRKRGKRGKCTNHKCECEPIEHFLLACI
jgi:hypothetical protein